MLFLVSVLLLIGFVFLTGRMIYPTVLTKTSNTPTPSTLVLPQVLFETSLTAMQKNPATTPTQVDLNIDSLACLQQVSAGWVCFGLLGNDSDAYFRSPQLTVTLTIDDTDITRTLTPLIPIIPPQTAIPFHIIFPAMPDDLIPNQTSVSAMIAPASYATAQQDTLIQYRYQVPLIDAIMIDAYGQYHISYHMVQDYKTDIVETDVVGVAMWLFDDEGMVVGYRVMDDVPPQPDIVSEIVVIPYVIDENLMVGALAWVQPSPKD